MTVVVLVGYTTRLTSLARTAGSEKTLVSLDITRDFGNLRPLDPWFGDL